MKKLLLWHGLLCLLFFAHISEGRSESAPMDHYDLLSETGLYRLALREISESTTGSIALIDEGTSKVLATQKIPPGKLRARPRALWRDDSADVAVELETFNANSPAYVFYQSENHGHVVRTFGSLCDMSAFLGIDCDRIVRAHQIPVEWLEGNGDYAKHVIRFTGRCWDKSGERFTRRNEPLVLNADGELLGR